MGLPKQELELEPQQLTFQEYIKLEKENNQKYEYHDGFLVAMAGGTNDHARICKNIVSEIDSVFKKQGDKCEVFNSDIKLAFKDKKKYLYPDAMVVCGEVEESENKNYGVTNPLIIIEVLSKSTQDFDREDKFGLYKQIASLEYYILISQDKPDIEMYRRMKLDKQDTNKSLWQIETLTGIDKTLSFPTLDLEIPFTDIYRKIEF